MNKRPLLRSLIAYNFYGAYCVPLSASHRPAAQLVLSGRVYEPQTIDFMRKNCNNGDIVHAGTFFGDFLPGLADNLAEGAKIWAFEPNLENFRCAKITLELNGIDNVELRNAGVGEKEQTLQIQTTDAHGQSLGGASRVIPAGQNVNVATQAIGIHAVDNIVPTDRTVSILQFDVEGFEQAALAGSLKTIERCKPIIILEIWQGNPLPDSDWFKENILSLGYQKSGELHGNYVYSCP